ncbi:hypothetical protein IDM40_21445 [Nocardiopsis sp. HNM0947]|uniref:Xylulokinase n=1 Tax=Nocardiopsis coralli TaxID=2772213 RepID=A0ABR9PBM3_9ACTN|nr:FGGY family carbohydrate kinase [Nocardiopsis coralli]MBE3001237.1 hypothetical protein [Nocardiopsis coralli]
METTATLGIDLGTTGVKVIALDTETGRVVAEAAGEYPTLHPEPGAHEQDPRAWWAAARDALRTVTAALGDHRVIAVGLSGQMHSLLLTDAAGEAVGAAMTWADRRVGADTGRLAADPRFRDRAGNEPVDAFTAPKLAWLARTDPGRLARAHRLVSAKDHLRFHLTGTWATDTTDAVGTLLYDVHEGRWSPELWRAVGATPDLAARVLAPDAAAGSVTARAARATGLPEGTPVATGAGDVPAAVLGSGVTHRSQVCLNAGTAAQVMRPTEEADAGAGFLFGAAYGEAPFLAMASLYAAGAALRWAGRTLLGAGEDLSEVAATAPAGSDGLTYLPFMYGATLPRKDDAALGGFLGQREAHDRAALVRAVVEGVAFGCADAVGAVSAIAGEAGPPREIRLVGGVTRSALWREAFASVVDADVCLVPEGGSPRGAALLGLSAAGGDARQVAALSGRTEPVHAAAGADHDRYREAYARYRARAAHHLAADTAFGGETPA